MVQAVYEFRRRGRGIGQNAQPREWIDALIEPDVAFRNRWSADAMESVATANEIALDLVRFLIVGETYFGLFRVQIMHSNMVHFKQHRSAGAQAGRNEILHNLILPIHDDASSCERRHINTAAFP